MTLRSVREDRDGEQVIAQGALAIREYCSGGHGKLVAASAAFPDWPGRERRNLHASAFRAVRFAAVIRPPDAPEHVPRFIIGKTRNGAQCERPGFFRQEEVLRQET